LDNSIDKHKDTRLDSFRQKIIKAVAFVLDKVGMLTPERQQRLKLFGSTKTEKGIHRIERSLDKNFPSGPSK